MLACAHASPATVSTMPTPVAIPAGSLLAQVDAAREEARKLLIVQAELAWNNWVLGDPLDLAKTYLGHEQLFSQRTIELVRTLEAETKEPQRHRALGYFRVYLSGEMLSAQTAALSDEVSTIEASATFWAPLGKVNGAAAGSAEAIEHPYREIDRLTAAERDHHARVSLYAAATVVVDKLNPLLHEKEERIRTLLPSLGYGSYGDFGAELRSTDLTALKKTADDVLVRSEAFYRPSMERELQTELGLSLADTRRADLSRFNRSADLDAYFSADKMLPRLRETLKGLGIDLDAQSNIRIDDAPLPNKNPRAVCFNAQVPKDIRLSVKPLGGVTDYRALFHEAGHAEHYANTKTQLFEFQQLGDNAPTEAYAFVFEDLIDNPLWLADHTGLSGPKLADFVRASAVKKLYLLRRYAGKLIFELAWHAGDPDPQRLYQSVLSRAYGFPVSDDDAKRYLVDHDPFFYAADYFQAWFLAAQIEAKLRERFGERWWMLTGAGDLLKSLWAEGNGLTVDEIARRLGDPGLRIEPLLQHLEAALATQHP